MINSKKSLQARFAQNLSCLLLAIVLASCFIPTQPASGYVQQAVAGPLYQNDVICFVGDSLTGRGDGAFQSVFANGWINRLRQLNQAYHPSYNFTLVNAGYAYLSSTVLDYPGHGSEYWNQYVVNAHPNVVVIWIGIDDMLAGGGNNFNMSAYGVNLQAIIDAARAIPTVRQVVLATPMCFGEKRVGQNPYDQGIANVIAVIQQTSINNSIPVIDLRSMIVDADLTYNSGNYPTGVLLGDANWGIHPICSTSASPPDQTNFSSDPTNWLIAVDIYQALGE